MWLLLNNFGGKCITSDITFKLNPEVKTERLQIRSMKAGEVNVQQHQAMWPQEHSASWLQLLRK